MNDGARTMGVMERVIAERPTHRRRRRIWIAAVLLIPVLVVAILVIRSASSGPAAIYATAPVTRGTLALHVDATGTLQPTTVVTVGSEVSGTIADVAVDINDRVTKGQILARLDLNRLRDAASRSRAALEAADANVAQNEATERQARASLARQREVSRLSGGLTPSRTELDAAEADVARATANGRSARAAVSQARAQLSSDLTNLARGTIVSPVDGVVLTRSIEPGQTVAATFSAPNLFLIARDLHTMKLQVRIDEADVGLVKPGSAASFRVDAFPGRSYPAKVVRVNVASNGFGASTDGKTVSGDGVVVYTAVMDVLNPDLSLQPGMTASARIDVSRLERALLVPDAALRFRPKPDVAKAGIALSVGPSRDDETKQVAVGRGRRQFLYTLAIDGSLAPVAATIRASDGVSTALSDTTLHPGTKIVTGLLGQGAN